MSILITGANRGIGRELFDQYNAAKRDVLGTSRADTPDLLSLDVTKPRDHTALASRLKDTPIDLLICNAGVYLDKDQRLENGYDADLWDRTFATNVTGVFLSVQSLLPNLRLATNPRIAIISSQMATPARAKGDSYIYRASKAAVLNLGQNLSTELKPQGIAVGIYHPGWVRTDMGGTGAAITVNEAASGLISRFDALNIARTGCFENWDGTQPD